MRKRVGQNVVGLTLLAILGSLAAFELGEGWVSTAGATAFLALLVLAGGVAAIVVLFAAAGLLANLFAALGRR